MASRMINTAAEIGDIVTLKVDGARQPYVVIGFVVYMKELMYIVKDFQSQLNVYEYELYEIIPKEQHSAYLDSFRDTED